jgi:hypothetical protein
MRRGVILIALLVMVVITALLAMRRPPRDGRAEAPGSTATNSSQALLARAEANPGRNTRGREFLKRVYSRLRNATPEPDSAGMEQIARVLEAGETDAVKARRLLALAKSLPDDEQLEAAEHAVNLVTDGDYDVLRTVLGNPLTPEAVLDTLMADALGRGNSLKLPALVAVARAPEHPLATEARDLLELHIGEDHGTNWTVWLEAAKNHIAEHGE